LEDGNSTFIGRYSLLGRCDRYQHITVVVVAAAAAGVCVLLLLILQFRY